MAQERYLPAEILEHDGGEMKLFNRWSYAEIETGKDISLQVLFSWNKTTAEEVYGED